MIRDLLVAPEMVEMALEQAYRQAGADLEPQQRQLEGVWVALWENETKIQGMLEAIGTGNTVGPLLAMLTRKRPLCKWKKNVC